MSYVGVEFESSGGFLYYRNKLPRIARDAVDVSKKAQLSPQDPSKAKQVPFTPRLICPLRHHPPTHVGSNPSN